MAEPSAPESRAETIRESVRRVLREGPTTLRELSGAVSVSEKDLAAHLEHLERSLRRGDERLVVEPAACLACGFEFGDRKRFA
ncbi:transcriptional regulator [Nannocystaceae bacterium ST9]